MEGCTSLSPPIDVVPMHLDVLPVMGGGGGEGLHSLGKIL